MEQSDFIFYNRPDGGGIQSGGFSVDSLFMKQGRTPIVTLNTKSTDSNNISDQFNDLVIPSWLMYSPLQQRGGYQDGGHEETSVIEDNLYDELLNMAKEGGSVKKKNTRRRLKNINKGVTKRNRKS
jgi:hypothetical protein